MVMIMNIRLSEEHYSYITTQQNISVSPVLSQKLFSSVKLPEISVERKGGMRKLKSSKVTLLQSKN